MFTLVIDRATLVVVAEITGLARRDSQLTARAVEVFKGDVIAGEPFAADVVQGWGIVKGDWFQVGETCLMLCNCTPLTSMGYVGRMPLVELDGEIFIRVFVPDQDFFDPIETRLVNGMRLAPWPKVRQQLLAITNQPEHR